jgi:hypothetical protein
MDGLGIWLESFRQATVFPHFDETHLKVWDQVQPKRSNILIYYSFNDKLGARFQFHCFKLGQGPYRITVLGEAR